MADITANGKVTKVQSRKISKWFALHSDDQGNCFYCSCPIRQHHALSSLGRLSKNAARRYKIYHTIYCPNCAKSLRTSQVICMTIAGTDE